MKLTVKRRHDPSTDWSGVGYWWEVRLGSVLVDRFPSWREAMRYAITYAHALNQGWV